MFSVGINAEDQLIPLAFALTEGENNASWQWFMDIVRLRLVGPGRVVCIVSDRHRGILNAVKSKLDEQCWSCNQESGGMKNLGPI